MLCALVRIGSALNRQGLCMGLVKSRDLYVNGETLSRTPSSRFRRLVYCTRKRWHLRQGHDHSCFTFGVPRSTVSGLLHGWGREDAAEFVLGLFDEALVEEDFPGDDSQITQKKHMFLPRFGDRRSQFECSVRQRITPRRPGIPTHAAQFMESRLSSEESLRNASG